MFFNHGNKNNDVIYVYMRVVTYHDISTTSLVIGVMFANLAVYNVSLIGASP